MKACCCLQDERERGEQLGRIDSGFESVCSALRVSFTDDYLYT